jgi:hypothetical protein
VATKEFFLVVTNWFKVWVSVLVEVVVVGGEARRMGRRRGF